MKTKIKWVVIIMIVVAFIIYKLPFCQEIRDYNKVVETNNIEACDKYVSEYPNGRHLDDVLFLKVSLSNNYMPVIVEYLSKCPRGEHAALVNTLCDKLWDAEIAKYKKRDKHNECSEAVIYMDEMLQYMKSHRVNTIKIDINSTLRLKDYNEYDKKVRDLIEFFNEKKELPVEQNIISIKENFTKEDNSTLVQILKDGVQKSIDKIFTRGFIGIVPADSARGNMPQLDFYYTIKTQDEKIGKYSIPDIWSYKANGVTHNYLLGITVFFKAHFSIPLSSTIYDYSESGEPEDEIGNIENIKDGYRKMTAMCFAKFSNKMSNNMGLAETYFQGK